MYLTQEASHESLVGIIRLCILNGLELVVRLARSWDFSYSGLGILCNTLRTYPPRGAVIMHLNDKAYNTSLLMRFWQVLAVPILCQLWQWFYSPRAYIISIISCASGKRRELLRLRYHEVHYHITQASSIKAVLGLCFSKQVWAPGLAVDASTCLLWDIWISATIRDLWP